MPRHLLSVLLLLSALGLAAPAMAMEPARHSADGGCPPAAETAATDGAGGDPSASPAQSPAVATPPSSQSPQRRTLSSGDATRVRLRWHSFVPGMFM